MKSKGYVRSEYESRITVDDKNTYVRREFKVKGKDPNLVRDTCEQMRRVI